MGELRSNLWRHAVAWVLIIFTALPIYVVIATSFDPSGGLATSTLFPTRFSLDNYAMLFENTEALPFWSWIKNSVLISGAAAIFSVMIGAGSAFAFSRLRFRGRKIGMQALLLVQVFPSILALSALYVLVQTLSDVFEPLATYPLLALFLLYLGGAMGINAWLLKGFLDTIPMELDESARVDGASVSQVYWLIFLPLAAPVLAVVALLSFIGTFNEFVLASLFLQDPDSLTVAVGLQRFIAGQRGEDWGPFAAGSIIASVPLVILFLSLQKYIVGGLTAGSVKG